jgi:hypothetical protein
LIVILITFVGCQNEAEQNQDAIDEVTKTQEDLREALEDAKVAEQNLLVSEEWILFKQAAYLQIAKNKADIEILRIKKAKTGRSFDTLYEKRIDQLVVDNDKLNQRLAAFEKTKAIGRNLKLNLKTICLTWVKPSIISQLIMLNKCQKLKEKKSKRVKY